MEIEVLKNATFPPLLFASDGNWYVSDPPTLEIVLPSVPLPAAQGHSRRLDSAHRPAPVAGVQGQRQYHVEWRGYHTDLYSDDKTGDTWLTVLFAYLHLPDEDKATRKAKVAARRAAREAAKQQAILADEYDTKKTPKKYPPQPIEDVDPNVETVTIAYVPMVAMIVETWIEKHFDPNTQALEIAGQAALRRIRAGNRLSEKRMKEIDEELNALDKKQKTLEEERAKALGEVKAWAFEEMRAEGIERAQVIVRGEPSDMASDEQRRWGILQQATAMLCDVRWRKAALERKRQLAQLWLELPKKQGGKGATIAEELFAEGLLKLVEIVPSLPSLGRKNKWDDEAPERILYYLTKVVKSAIYDYYKAARRFRGPRKKKKDIVRALRRRKPREYRTTIYKEAHRSSNADPEWLYDGNARYVLQCDRSGIAAMEEQEYMQWAIDQVCRDQKDRPLLWMKEEGIFTESEIGEVLDLKEKQIRKRLRRMRKELEELFELRRRKCDKDKEDNDKKEKEECSKRVAKNSAMRKLGEEFMVSWRKAKLMAAIVLPTSQFLLLPATAAPPQFRPTPARKADRAWHLRYFAITPNSRVTVRKEKSRPVSSPNRASGVM